MSEMSKAQKSAIQRAISLTLANVRPDEAFLVDNLFDPPVSVAKKTEALGMGTDVQVVLWMYPLMHVLGELANTAMKEFAKKWGDHLAEWMQHSSSAHTALTADALMIFRMRVVERLETSGALAADANRAADAMVSVLVEQPAIMRDVAGAK
jgi:hypothetical protein